MAFNEHESKHLEFKSEPPAFHKLIKTCVAFANGIGGEIVIGVDDRTQKIIGIDDKTRERIYENFPNALYDSTQPSLIPQIYERLIDKKSVLIIKIAPTNRKPCFVKSAGIPEGVYCRVGAHTRKATAYYIEELMRSAHNQFYDAEPVGTTIDILDKNILKTFYSTKSISPKKLLNDKIVIESPANPEIKLPTIAGMLLFSNAPHEHIPEANIICSRFMGTEGRDIIQTEDVCGNLLEQSQLSLDLIKSWLLRDYKLFGAQLKAESIVPETALRETINNALLHRKYNIPGAIKIALYDNRLEIFNPGQFPGLVDITNLGDGTTFLRNPNLVRMARRFGLIEKLGTGIKLVMSECIKAGIQQPQYYENGDYVKVVFEFKPAKSLKSTKTELIMTLFNYKSEIAIDDVIEQLDCSRNTATRYLNQLIDENKIMRIGKGPSVRYQQIR